MGFIAVEKEWDQAFFEALEGHDDGWKMRAIAGYTVRTVADDFRDHRTDLEALRSKKARGT